MFDKIRKYLSLKPRVLSFSEYRIKNALFLQKKLDEGKVGRSGDPATYIIAMYYVKYLSICGASAPFDLFHELMYMCNRDYRSFDEKIVDNLVDIMDHILDLKYLESKYNLRTSHL